MNTVNALKIRNHFGEVLEMLDNGKEPECFAVPELFTYEILSVLYRHHPDVRLIYNEGLSVNLFESGYDFLNPPQEN